MRGSTQRATNGCAKIPNWCDRTPFGRATWARPHGGCTRRNSRRLDRINKGMLKAPTLIIWGYNDPTAPYTLGVDLMERSARWSTATELHIINRSGHLVYAEHPEKVTGLISGLRGLRRNDGIAHKKTCEERCRSRMWSMLPLVAYCVTAIRPRAFLRLSNGLTPAPCAGAIRSDVDAGRHDVPVEVDAEFRRAGGIARIIALRRIVAVAPIHSPCPRGIDEDHSRVMAAALDDSRARASAGRRS